MCLILFAHKCHAEFPLVIAANRDEFYERPTRPAQWWGSDPDLLGGKDLSAGGSWFCVNKKGRFAALTNIREPYRFDKGAPSRGTLVTDFLLRDMDAMDYIAEIENSNKEYNGFNLLLGDGDDIFYFSNRAGFRGKLDPGVYGLSNYLLDTPWPKVSRGKNKLTKLLEEKDLDPEGLLTGLLDKERANDADLPSTGVPLEWERSLSSMFIETENYGTRCSTILRVSSDHQVDFVEKSFIPEDYREYSFEIQI